MSKGGKLTVALLFLAAAGKPARSQNTKNGFWPELDTYVNYGSRLRVVFVDSFDQDQNTRHLQGSFGYFLDVALKPLFRRELREREDVFRRRFLTFRGG